MIKLSDEGRGKGSRDGQRKASSIAPAVTISKCAKENPWIMKRNRLDAPTPHGAHDAVTRAAGLNAPWAGEPPGASIGDLVLGRFASVTAGLRPWRGQDADRAAPRGGLGHRRGVDGPPHLECRADRQCHLQRAGIRAPGLLERCARKRGGLRRRIGKLMLANGFWNRGKSGHCQIGLAGRCLTH
jgi:hypothetical protein